MVYQLVDAINTSEFESIVASDILPVPYLQMLKDNNNTEHEYSKNLYMSKFIRQYANTQQEKLFRVKTSLSAMRIFGKELIRWLTFYVHLV